MSKRILQALMQLFAIIARPESNKEDRRSVVKSFLFQQLNSESVHEYIRVFDHYYLIHQKPLSGSRKRKKRTSSSSVKVLKICTEINQELTQKQKTMVLVLLLEFVKSDKLITQQELEFVQTVAETFYFPEDEYRRIKEFVLGNFNSIPDIEELLLVNNKEKLDNANQVKHFYAEELDGEIRVLYINLSESYIIRYLGDTELYLNSQLLKPDKVYGFTSGSSIKNPLIKSIYYSDVVNAFISDKSGIKTVIEVKNVDYTFRNGTKGLHQINFSEQSGRLIGIMGASGTGKTTLVNVLNGSHKPGNGQILINGIDIHNESNKVKGLIGHVSQDDLLIEELTVFQNLYFNAKLCFQDYNDFQINRTVLRILKSLGLLEVKDSKVGNPLDKYISGGQRKRLNIALELIREPAILFLDEPTSGLSSRDSDNIMDLLKELTLKGKMIFVVIHQPSSDIFKMLDELILLDQGGYMIYKGHPVESIIYFKSQIHHAEWNQSECRVCGNVNPEQIFNIVNTEVIDEYGNTTQTRKISPEEWEKIFKREKKQEKRQKLDYPFKKIPAITFKIPNWFRQLRIFIIRDLLAKLTNQQYIIINLFEAPALAFLLSYLFKYYQFNNETGYIFSENKNIPVYIFMAVIVAIFMGLSLSSQEIIKDRKILKRERFLNLSRSSYLVSKIILLLSFSAIQAFLFLLVGNLIMEIKQMFFAYWLALFSTWSFGVMLGLLISDSFKTPVAIYILIPFLIIPQIILSGVIVDFDELNPAITKPNNVPWYGEIMISRWSYEAISVHQFKNNAYEKPIYKYDKSMSEAHFKKNYWLKKLDNKLSYCIDYIEKGDGDQQEYKQKMALIRTELEKEFTDKPYLAFDSLHFINKRDYHPDILYRLKSYFELLDDYYTRKYNLATQKRDSVIIYTEKTYHTPHAYTYLKRKYHNKRLSEFLRNSNDLQRIVEYDNELFQLIDPIFNDPHHPFLKAHFYAPRKKMGNYYVDTFWINIIIMWTMTGIIYIFLYYGWIKSSSNYLGEKYERIKQKKRLKGQRH